MKISKSYKLISGLLSLSVVLSFTLSICSMNTMEEMCDQMMMDHNSMMEMSHSSDHEDMEHEKPTSSTSDCLMTIDCECTIDREVSATIAPTILLKTNISPVTVSLFETKNIERSSFSLNSSTIFQGSYSPPPLFLANQSFLI